jgi:predicted nucleic acid-binding protein
LSLIVVDASVLIGHLDGSDAHHQRAVAVLLATAGQPLLASPITVAEVLAGPARTGRLEDAQNALDEIGLGQVPFGPDAAVRLATLRAETSLGLPDCCVLLAAQDARAAAIATFDDRLAAAARRAGVGVES